MEEKDFFRLLPRSGSSLTVQESKNQAPSERLSDGLDELLPSAEELLSMIPDELNLERQSNDNDFTSLTMIKEFGRPFDVSIDTSSDKGNRNLEKFNPHTPRSYSKSIANDNVRRRLDRSPRASPSATEILKRIDDTKTELTDLCEEVEDAILLNMDEQKSLRRRIEARFRSIHSWLKKEEEAVLKKLDCCFHDSRRPLNQAFSIHQKDLSALSTLKVCLSKHGSRSTKLTFEDVEGTNERHFERALNLTNEISQRMENSEMKTPGRIACNYKESIFWIAGQRLPLGTTVEIVTRPPREH